MTDSLEGCRFSVLRASFLEKVLKFGNRYGKMVLPHKFIFSCCKRAFFFGKNAGSAFVRFGVGLNLCGNNWGYAFFGV